MSPNRQRDGKSQLDLEPGASQTAISARIYNIDFNESDSDGCEAPIRHTPSGKFTSPVNRIVSTSNMFLNTEQSRPAIANMTSVSAPDQTIASDPKFQLIESVSESQKDNKFMVIMSSMESVSSSSSEDEKDPFISAQIVALDALERYKAESKMGLNIDVKKIIAESSVQNFTDQAQDVNSDGNPGRCKSVLIESPEGIIVDERRQTDASVSGETQSKLSPLSVQLNKISVKSRAPALTGMSVDLHPVADHDQTPSSATYTPCYSLEFTCPHCRNRFHFSNPSKSNFFSPRFEHCADKDVATEVIFKNGTLSPNKGIPRNGEIQKTKNLSRETSPAKDIDTEAVFEKEHLDDLPCPNKGIPLNDEIQKTNDLTRRNDQTGMEFEDTPKLMSFQSIELEYLDFPAEIDESCGTQPPDVGPAELTQMALKYTFVDKDITFCKTEGIRSSPEDPLFG